MNPDLVLIRRFERERISPLPVDSCPLAGALNAQLVRVDRERREIEMAFTPGKSFLQGNGVLQGGIVSAMLDFAMGFSALMGVEDSENVATTNISVAFLKGIPADIPLKALGMIEQQGSKVAFTHGQLWLPDGRLAASASSTLLMIR